MDRKYSRDFLTAEDKFDDDSCQSASDIQPEDESPMEEVRATIPNTDDPSMPCNTFRMWFLGLMFAGIQAFINQFFFMRQTTISIGYSIVALISLPLGHLMARTLPTREFTIFGRDISFNPGPFSIKEHVLIGVMTAANNGTAYAVDIIIIQKLFYHDQKPFIAGLLLVSTTQVTGFALAGALRRLLVRPAHMLWPSTLVTASLFRSLHVPPNAEEDRGKMSRMKYFMFVTLGMFVYNWLPGLMFPTIGVLSWLCWLNPDNIVLSQLTGSDGLGIGTVSLDWAAVSSYVQPLVTPWFAQVNILVGFVLAVYIMVPWAYYVDLWDSKTYPILSAHLYLENGSAYDKDQILTHGLFDQAKYDAYGPLRMDSFFALTYGAGFAALTSTLVHVALYNGQEVLQRWRSARQLTDDDDDDIHTRLMRSYPEVPNLWYIFLFAASLALAFLTCVLYAYMPWWALFLALFLAIIFVLPVGIVQAITNQQPSLNIVAEYTIGYLLPGHAIANVTFKTYGYIVNYQALTFAADLKLAHYMKIPPRVMFAAQIASTLLCALVNLVTAQWLISTRPNICTPRGYPFTCRSTNTFYAASIIWGAIGPARVFGSKDHAIYAPVQWGFLAGALLPIPFYLASRQWPRVHWLKLVHWPVLLAATSNIPPALPYMYANGLVVGFVSMCLLKRCRYGWWARYNYLTSAALDTGVAVSGLAIFFTVQVWEGGFPYWWGNPENGVYDHCPLGSANYYKYIAE
ncbi:hypothetical protein BGZ82_008698 [Podila clonocystis]|nr:hypothetical protein BGZ82_008698 [Podila clonocystis]